MGPDTAKVEVLADPQCWDCVCQIMHLLVFFFSPDKQSVFCLLISSDEVEVYMRFQENKPESLGAFGL